MSNSGSLKQNGHEDQRQDEYTAEVIYVIVLNPTIHAQVKGEGVLSALPTIKIELFFMNQCA